MPMGADNFVAAAAPEDILEPFPSCALVRHGQPAVIDQIGTTERTMQEAYR